VIVVTALEAPAVVSSLHDFAVVGQPIEQQAIGLSRWLAAPQRMSGIG
jgi:hypothetical protein